LREAVGLHKAGLHPALGGEDRGGLLQQESYLVWGHIADIEIDNIKFVFLYLGAMFDIKIVVDDQYISALYIVNYFVYCVFHIFIR
jgi:hypothetical protein